VYELEAEWFDSLQRRRSGKGLQLTSRSVVMRTQLRPGASKARYVWLAIVGLSVVGRLASTIPQPNGHSITLPVNSQYSLPVQTPDPPGRLQQPAEDTPRETPTHQNSDIGQPFESPYSDRSLRRPEINNDQIQGAKPPVDSSFAIPRIELDGRYPRR